jgi:hypothetical protein
MFEVRLQKDWCSRQSLGVVYGKEISFEGGLGSFWDFLFHFQDGCIFQNNSCGGGESVVGCRVEMIW